MTKTRSLQLLQTMDEVDAILGGTVATARIAGKSPASISNAKGRGNYPKDTYHVMREALAQRGYRAPASLWRQVEAAPSQECA